MLGYMITNERRQNKKNINKYVKLNLTN